MPKAVTDQIEAGARALAGHKQLSWPTMRETWRTEQLEQARLVLEAAATAAGSDGYVSEDDGFIPPATAMIG